MAQHARLEPPASKRINPVSTREAKPMTTPVKVDNLNIAIIGGGVAGITAAHLLKDAHRVTLFEKNDYVGGHTNTVVIPTGRDAGTPVDTGFIVLNDRTYPVLNRFFELLDVAIEKSDMSFSYYCERTGFQYASRTLDSLFAQRANLRDLSYWALLADIVRFNRLVLSQHKARRLEGLTLGRFLQRFKFSQRFRDQYLFPMVAAIWSAPDAQVDRFPMVTFARFFDNHGLLTLFRQPQWYFVAGGSQTYVRAFLERFAGTVHTDAKAVSVRRAAEGVTVTTSDGQDQRFDRVVIATHADEALEMLADPSDDERRCLAPWRYSINETFLHTDTRWMPSNHRAWASWNFIREAGAAQDAPVTLTYHMNRLQQLDAREQYLVTLNPFKPIDEGKIIARMTYTHPTYSFDSIATQSRLPLLNGKRNTYFCGSYFGYGFHEDAARSGARVASDLGVDHDL
jgi:predicted NAD/FAD-binding protein